MAIVADLGPFVPPSDQHPSRPRSTVDKLDELLPELRSEEAARIRHLLWYPDRTELIDLYCRHRGRRPTHGAQAVIAELRDLVTRGTWFGQRDLARRVFGNPDHLGPVIRVLHVLRAAGVLVSEGGEFVPVQGKATCQRHAFAPSESLLEITSAYRLVSIRAYFWLTTVAGWAPDDAREAVRRPRGLEAVLLTVRAHQAKRRAAAAAAAKAVHGPGPHGTTVSISAALPSAFAALQGGTSHLPQSLPKGSLCPDVDPDFSADGPLTLIGYRRSRALRRRQLDNVIGLPPRFLTAAQAIGDHGPQGSWARVRRQARAIGWDDERAIWAYQAAVSDTMADRRSRLSVGKHPIVNAPALAMWRCLDVIKPRVSSEAT